MAHLHDQTMHFGAVWPKGLQRPLFKGSSILEV